MAGIKYNGSKLIPAPFVGIQKTYQKTADGSKVGSLFTLDIQGKLLNCKGSPTSSGTFWTVAGYPPDESLTTSQSLASYLQKEEAIRELFASEGKLLEIEPWDNSPAVSGYMRVNEINFPAANWVDTVEYTISLETDQLFGFPGAEDAALGEEYFDASGNRLFLQEVAEDWGLEFNDQPADAASAHSFRLTHNVSAVGKSAYDATGLISEPWVQAQRWVAPRLGLDNTFLHSTSGLDLASDYSGYNHVRSENTDEQGGSYAVSETWVISSGNAFEDFTITSQGSSESSLTQVSVEGLVTGLDTRNTNFQITQTKWDAALAKFNAINPTTIYTRASSYSGVTALNSTALSSSVGRNPVAGTISYSLQYDDRPSTCINGALSETIQISDVNSHDVFVALPVIGRPAGPVLQDIGSQTETTRTVSVDVIIPLSGICPGSVANVGHILDASPKSEVDTIMQSFEDHLDANYTQVFKNQDTENWQPWVGRYSRVVGWTYQSCS
jgi:hypothetical protein